MPNLTPVVCSNTCPDLSSPTRFHLVAYTLRRTSHIYRSRGADNKLQQECLLVPLLVDGAPKDLILNSDDHELWHNGHDEQNMRKRMHYTCIERIKALAHIHPLVVRVERHTERSKGTVTPESEGRVIDGHQSNFNLNIVIAAASGAYFKIGLTAHHVRRDLLSIWWSPGSGMDSLHRQLAECIFYDVTEADHINVNVLKNMQPLAQTGQEQQQIEVEMQEKERVKEEVKGGAAGC